MAASVRQSILNAIKTRLQSITVVNGYETDIGSNVNMWHTTDFQETELPAIDLRDPAEEVETRGGNHICTLTIEIEAKVSGSASDITMRDIIADIIKAVGTDPTFGGLTQDTKPVSNDSLGFGQNSKKIASIVMTFEARYITKKFSPYNLA